MSKSLIKSSSALALANFSKRALLGLTVLICARFVTKATFGNYMFLMTLYQIFASIGGAGIPYTLVRDVACDRAWRPERWSASVAARSLYTIPATAAMFAFFVIGGFSLNLLPNLWIICGIMVFRAATENAISIFQGREEALSCALIAFVQSAITLLATLEVCFTSRSLAALIACHLIGAVGSTIFSIFLFYRRGLPIHFGITGAFTTIRTVMVDAGWLDGSMVLSMAYNRCDVLLLERLATEEAVAVYGAPYRILDIAQIIPQGVTGILLARISSHTGGKALQLNRRSVRALLLLGTLLVSVLAIPLVPILIPLVLGKSYTPSIQVAEVLIWVAPLMCINLAINTDLMAHRFERFIFYNCLVALIFNSVLNYLLIPRYGYMASAFLTLGTELLIMNANLWSCRKTGIPFHIASGAEIALTTVFGIAGAIVWNSTWVHRTTIGAPLIAIATTFALIGIRKALSLQSPAME